MPIKRISPTGNNTSNIEYTNLEPGEYEGRLVYVADLGLQERSYKGEEKPPAQQISLGIEILGETVLIDGEQHPRMLWTKPFNIFHKMSDKGAELKYYSVFEPGAKEDTVADWDNVIGRPCNVVVANVRSGDNVYDNITDIQAIPKKYQANVPDGVMEGAVGDASDPENPAQKAMYGLAKYVFEKRIDADEPQHKEPARSTPEPRANDEFDDDIPF